MVWWLLGAGLGLFIFGCYVLGLARPVPWAAATGLVIWILVGVAHWWVLTKFPYFAPVGRAVRWLALAWGLCVATSLALVIENAWARVLPVLAPGDYAADMALVYAPTEETVKGLGILVVFIFVQRPRTLVEGLVIGATVGIGFAFAENLTYGLRYAQGAGDAEPVAMLQTIAQRAVVSVSSHWVYSGIVGVGLGYAICARWAGPGRRTLVPLGCFVLAMVLHACWDLPISIGNLTAAGREQALWLQYLVVGTATIGILLLFTRWARNREGEYYVTYLVRHGSNPLPEDQLHALPHGLSRRAARREAGSTSQTRSEGQRTRKAVRSLHRAAAMMAVALAQRNAAAESAGREALRTRLAVLDEAKGSQQAGR
jgi:RsiW-degrading membrane proteinase PrsW (M82 family)